MTQTPSQIRLRFHLLQDKTSNGCDETQISEARAQWKCQLLQIPFHMTHSGEIKAVSFHIVAVWGTTHHKALKAIL